MNAWLRVTHYALRITRYDSEGKQRMRLRRVLFVAIVALGFMLPPALATRAASASEHSRFTFHVSDPRVTFQNQPAVGMRASAGFGDDGSYVIGSWFPVRVELDN